VLCPPDPFATFNEDYGAAVVRLAWAVDRTNNERILLCGCAELVPREVPPPEATLERWMEVAGRRYFVYAHDVVVPADRGVQWFDETEEGVCIRIGRDGGLPDSRDPAALRFTTATLAPEPPRPAVVAPTIRVPFGADWHCTPRVRHLIATTDVRGRFSAGERLAIAKWLGTELHLDLELLPEFWGSVHLIAPNPIFRSLRFRLDCDDKGQSSHVYAIAPRSGRTVAGLQLIVEEERTAGLGVVASVRLTDAVTRLPVPTTPGSLRERVVDPARGILWDSPFRALGVGFAISVDLSAAVRTVTATRHDEEAYSVSLVGGLRNEVRHEGRAPLPAATVLHQASMERNRRQRGAEQQRWFRNRSSDGIKALRDVIGKVKNEVLICDPYFGGDDVRRLVLAIADPAVPVQILASAMHLHRERADGVTEGRYLNERLAEAMRAPPMNPTEIRVVTGAKAAIHDRFLWLGDRLWMLGSSVNRFGNRGTLMVVAPDHEPVLEDLKQVWTGSPTLAQWLAERRPAAPTPWLRRWMSVTLRRLADRIARAKT
jgi:hypothetical protein